MTAQETDRHGAGSPRLLDAVRARIRAKHYSLRTEQAYLHWIKRFIYFHDKRHPREMGAAEVERFLSSLAVDDHVSASTQNQAFAAPPFPPGRLNLMLNQSVIAGLRQFRVRSKASWRSMVRILQAVWIASLRS